MIKRTSLYTEPTRHLSNISSPMKRIYRTGIDAPTTGAAPLRMNNHGIFVEAVGFQSDYFFGAGRYAATTAATDGDVDCWC